MMDRWNAITTLALAVAIGYGAYRLTREEPVQKWGDGNYTDSDLAQAQVLHEVLRQCYMTNTPLQFFQENQEYFTSDSDLEGLMNAFGVRPYDRCVSGFPDWMYIQRDLLQYMHRRLDQDERDQINAWFAERGITYRI